MSLDSPSAFYSGDRQARWHNNMNAYYLIFLRVELIGIQPKLALLVVQVKQYQLHAA